MAALMYSLRDTQLFDGLQEEDLRTVAGFAVSKKIAKNEYVFRQDEPSAGFYVVRIGLINVHHVGVDGREQVIHLFGPGETFAEASIFSETGNPSHARAVKASEVILIPKQDFVQLVQQRSDLALRMMAAISRHARMLVSSLDSLRLKDAETRLVEWLLGRCPHPMAATAVEVDLGMTKLMLAAEIGARQETLSRILSRLRNSGHIIVGRHSITVNNPLTLQRLVEMGLPSRRSQPANRA